MKRIFTLVLFLFFMLPSNSQVLLNEVYPIPSPTRHEFFELYNNNPGAATPMDNYTLVSYFEEPGNKKGFYVMDFPALSISPLSYFVGAAAKPFNFQGTLNCTTADFSWNDTAFLHANNGYLKKWVKGTNVAAAIDGNANYDLEAVPSNFNDFFCKIGGGNASYNVFLYKNGVLANCFMGGVGGASVMPTYIMPMPDLFVDMAGGGNDHTLAFSTYGSVAVEYVIQDVGTDNGYIRLRDGYCGTWNKSSAQVNHTPGFTNAGDPADDLTVSVAAVVSPGNAQTGPYVIYDVVSADLAVFPVSLYIYNDNGGTLGSLDAGDTFLGSNVETVVTDGPFQTYFTPPATGIIIVVYGNAGCILRIMHIPNTGGVLPLSITDFKSIKDNAGYELKWNMHSNELAQTMELQSSSDGENFQAYSMMSPALASGEKTYSYRINNLTTGTFFRVKVKDIEQKTIYSPAIFIDSRQAIPGLVIRSAAEGNIVRFTYNSQETTQGTVSIYNSNGSRVMSKAISLVKGQQQLLLPIEGSLGTGIYILELTTSNDRQTSRFMRR